MKKAIIINDSDNVAVALVNLKKGETLFGVTLKDDIKSGHKFSLTDIKAGDSVIKYGYKIGTACADISAGEFVHTHNLKTALGEHCEYTFNGAHKIKREESDITFMGYERADGRVGIRNSILIIPTVGCANKTAELIAKKAENEFNVQGKIHVFTHPYGCSQLGTDAENTAKCIAALCKHPNVGGALIISLGCENNNLSVMKNALGDYDSEHIKMLVTQQSEDEVADGVKLVSELLNVASLDKRTVQPIKKLTIGFKCGGSDGFSGITANPLCGCLSDYMCFSGGKVILTEVPEMFGAEQILFDRCVSEDVFSKAVDMINSFKDYFTSHNQVIYENPSPGNKEGGITTLEEKSVGCVTKGGHAAVTDVLGLYDTAEKDGLSLLWGPGNDIVSTTNLACAGAVMILFTTGRGTPLGAPVPTVKISTNSALSLFKQNWIDFNAGDVVNEKVKGKLFCSLIELVTETASGKLTKNEENGYEEIAIFKDGVTL